MIKLNHPNSSLKLKEPQDELVIHTTESRIDTLSGSYGKGILLPDVIVKYKAELMAVELGHLVGALAYVPFSWLNNPISCDGDVSNNLNSLYRHMAAIADGTPIDPKSGLPHPVHMACRAAMLVTVTALRKHRENYTPIHYDPTRLKDGCFGTLLTTQELVALAYQEYDVANLDGHDPYREMHNLLACMALNCAKEDIGAHAKLSEGIIELSRAIFVLALHICVTWIRDNAELFEELMLRYNTEDTKHIQEYGLELLKEVLK